MERKLYQLVAISDNGIEYVIELNNENKNNRGKLEFIDSGVARFKDSSILTKYLYDNGKIPTMNVSFSIKYKHNGEKYLPLVFDDKKIYALSKSKPESDLYQDFVFYLLKSMEIELNEGFYKYLMSVNNKSSKKKFNGNYLGSNLLASITTLYNDFIKVDDYSDGKADIEYSILKELLNYKQLRTMHIMYQDYCILKKQKKEVKIQQGIEYTKRNNGSQYEYDEIPEEIRKAYETDGMDGVYGIVDLDDLEVLSVKFKKR